MEGPASNPPPFSEWIDRAAAEIAKGTAYPTWINRVTGELRRRGLDPEAEMQQRGVDPALLH
jgi:hypothetical protein